VSVAIAAKIATITDLATDYPQHASARHPGCRIEDIVRPTNRLGKLSSRFVTAASSGLGVISLVVGVALLHQADGSDQRYGSQSWQRGYIDSRHSEDDLRSRDACHTSSVTTCNGLACTVQADEC
jgi:hypothetical protein